MIDVVLPVLDEAEAIPWVLNRLPDGYRAIVVDNGSADGSAEIAASLGADVVTEPQRGFGAACSAGLHSATTDIVCFMDCDGSLDPRQLPIVVEPVASARADLVLGRRRPTEHCAWPLHARWANRYLGWHVSRLLGIELRDLGPMRAAGREALLALDLADRRCGWPLEMVLKAGHANWSIAERDVDYLPRAGRSKVTGTIGGTLHAVRDMRRQLAAVAPPSTHAHT